MKTLDLSQLYSDRVSYPIHGGEVSVNPDIRRLCFIDIKSGGGLKHVFKINLISQ